MSTLNDVQNAMVNVITPVLYPNGTGSPSIANTNIYIFPGDPLKQDLDQILAAREIMVAVFAMRAMTRNTTRIRREYGDDVIQTATILLDVSHNTVTINGTVTVGQSCMIIVDGTGYAYAAKTGDTLGIIAIQLALLIPGASAVNNVVTIAGAKIIEARVSTSGTARQILHSQESVMRARVIAPSYQLRELVGGAIQLGFAEFGYYLPMPDLISASIKPNGIQEINTYEFDISFVRDYLYLVEYHTVQVSTFQTIADPYSVTQVGTLPN